jgi:hypothetical protein
MARTIMGKNILVEKSKFFTSRMLGYFSFFLIPLWVQKTVSLNALWQIVFAVIYMGFMSSQWYLLGKEIDHRFKIFYRTNSSIDRVLYRSIIGSIFFVIYYNFLSLLPSDIIKHFFWGTFALLGLFYSWPTRGKIIQEGISFQFGEYRYLDSFEKTLLFLIVVMFVFSIPSVPQFESVEAYKLYFDPFEQIHKMYWGFVEMNYFPFRKLVKLNMLSHHVHFYVYGMGLFLTSFYSLLRYFFSRRISILGVFSIVSSWSMGTYLNQSPILAFVSTFPIFWCWGILWVTKSSTYRSGLFLGVLCSLGAMINQTLIVVAPLIMGMVLYYESKSKTKWYRRQLIKYASGGILFAIILAVTGSSDVLQIRPSHLSSWFNNLATLIDQKAFYTLFFIGMIFLVLRLNENIKQRMSELKIEDVKILQIFSIYLIITVYGLVFEPMFVVGFSSIWVLAFLALLPLEWIFQSISRLRSRRNMIYVIYIMVCLLDSHFEGRVKTFLKFIKY